jgi:hypothetical protein
MLPAWNVCQFLYWASAHGPHYFYLISMDLYLPAALAMLAFQRVLTGWSSRGKPLLAVSVVTTGHFCAVWCGLLGATVLGVTTLCWLSFGLWFIPWR